MATLALSLAGQALGGAVGGPLGATIGRALGAIAGSAIDNALFAPEHPPKAIPEIRVTGSTEGAPISRVYGWNRVSGNIMWARELLRTNSTEGGDKGVGSSAAENEEILASFAIGLCEGEVAHIGRIWADNDLLDTTDLTISTYHGTIDQMPNGMMESVQGVGNVPAYRGLCYLVFENLPLSRFGNRIPNISVELCRVVGELEPLVKAVTIIPGASEFAYDPEPRVRIVSRGQTESENAHISQLSDWTFSIDQLLDLCPNLQHVALVVAWFGTDLRCAQCMVEPRVDRADKEIVDTSWRVSGLTRNNATPVSQHEGGAAYGGTPSDAAVIRAIEDLKARGVSVTLYPFLMMDIPADNALVDPYTQNIGQSAYPWRGRITCNPAPGMTGSPDQSAAATSEVATFLGQAQTADFAVVGQQVDYQGSTDWGYRRMVLHYAHLCDAAGGVDAFIIGSELRGLTQIRDGATSFPFVTGLKTLAADVKTVMGSATKLTYAADWSEYHGYQPGDAPGDKLFHLDSLWADANIDAVGIDNYLPLTDWRGQTEGLDADDWDSIYDQNYLDAGISSGEYFDWYYASPADRDMQMRTPISDSAYGEAWVWRAKDLVGWWSNTHHNRVSGARDANPTAWQPQSKPIWFTELGCGAVDKGANQPNAFFDPKSSEDLSPYFSSGNPDGLLQRQYLRAHMNHWTPQSTSFDDVDNLTSSVFAGRMVDPDRIYLWTWDARPHPAFPQLSDVWGDAPHHATGHWLTGRLGAMAGDELTLAIANEYGLADISAVARGTLIHGYAVAQPQTARTAIDEITAAHNLRVRQHQDGLDVIAPGLVADLDLQTGQLSGTERAGVKRIRHDADNNAKQMTLLFANRARDYQPTSVIAFGADGTLSRSEQTAMILEPNEASRISATLLAQRQAGERLEFDLPPSQMALEVGDLVTINGDESQCFQITEMRHDLHSRVQAEQMPDLTNSVSIVEGDGAQAPVKTSQAVPDLQFAPLPGDENAPGTQVLVSGAYSSPCPGTLAAKANEGQVAIATLQSNAILGRVILCTNYATEAVRDRGSRIIVELNGGHLSSLSDTAVLQAGNRLLLQHDDGRWEQLAFSNAELLSDGTYLLSNLLRGLQGTELAIHAPVSADNAILLLGHNTQIWPVPPAYVGQTLPIEIASSNLPISVPEISVDLPFDLVRPRAPVHLRTNVDHSTNDIALSWVRRTRGLDVWEGLEVELYPLPEVYQLRIMDGATTKRWLNLNSATHIYSQADQIADFGTSLPNFAFTVAQVDPVWGAGATATTNFAA